MVARKKVTAGKRAGPQKRAPAETAAGSGRATPKAGAGRAPGKPAAPVGRGSKRSAGDFEKLRKLAGARPAQPLAARLKATIRVPDLPSAAVVVRSLARPVRPASARAAEELRSRIPAAPRIPGTRKEG
jgi:hypothetical protein